MGATWDPGARIPDSPSKPTQGSAAPESAGLSRGAIRFVKRRSFRLGELRDALFTASATMLDRSQQIPR